MRRRRRCVALLLTIALAACQSQESLITTPSPAASSVVGQPTTPECPTIDLREPSGSVVDLTGEWTGDWFDIPPSTGQRTFLLQVGDCVWASVSDDQFRAAPAESRSLLAQYVGHVNTDFSITGSLVTIFRWVDPFFYGEQPVLSPVNLVITWDADGAIQLVEDREPGVQGSRCPNPVMWCPAPTVLDLVIPGPEPPTAS
jgi:hypothetical protein